MTLKTLVVGAGVLFLAAPVAAPIRAAAASASSCESLASRSLPNTTIAQAQIVAAGSFTPPPAGRQGRGPAAYTRAPGVLPRRRDLTPSSDSDIKIEVWLPAARSGTASSRRSATADGPARLRIRRWRHALAAGYATTSTDTGHVGNTACVRARPSREGGRHRLSRRSRDDGAGQGGRQRATTAARRSCRSSTAARSADARASPKRSAIRPTSTRIVAGAPADGRHATARRAHRDQRRCERDAGSATSRRRNIR